MESIIENIEKQLIEIEILKSIYSNPNEFKIEDEYALYEANEFVADRNLNKIPEHRIGLIIKFDANSDDNNDDNELLSSIPVEIVCRLPHEYPLTSQPEILCNLRCSKDSLNRKFYENLKNHINEIHNSDCSILTIIDWIKENLFKYLSSNSKNDKLEINNNTTLLSFARAWVYFHHIYSTEKRQNLIKWAKEFELTGFVMPGKPGVMCIEGNESNINEYMTRVKKLPWQKIQIREIESLKVNNINESRKFNSFEENCFLNDQSTTHNLGLLYDFLKEKNLSNVFSLFFGVDGKSSSSSTASSTSSSNLFNKDE